MNRIGRVKITPSKTVYMLLIYFFIMALTCSVLYFTLGIGATYVALELFLYAFLIAGLFIFRVKISTQSPFLRIWGLSTILAGAALWTYSKTFEKPLASIAFAFLAIYSALVSVVSLLLERKRRMRARKLKERILTILVMIGIFSWVILIMYFGV